MSEEQHDRIAQLMRESKTVDAFSFDGVIFMGYLPDSTKRYVESNESRPFYIWLHDTHTILSPSKNVKQ